jgi:hypothetical protein
MINVNYVDVVDPMTGITTTYAIIDWGNGDYTSMTKAEYDKEYPNGVNEASIK